MAGKKLWTKEETLELICLYESVPEIGTDGTRITKTGIKEACAGN